MGEVVDIRDSTHDTLLRQLCQFRQVKFEVVQAAAAPVQVVWQLLIGSGRTRSSRSSLCFASWDVLQLFASGCVHNFTTHYQLGRVLSM